MTGVSRSTELERTRIMLGLLESVERGEAQSQRRLAADLGVALGLVNAYIKRCITKGLVKVSEAPARRYAYYLTPHGFAEKSRLTVEYLSSSFSLFRRARADCSELMVQLKASGSRGVVLAGMSDLAEIALICALENNVKVFAIVDHKSASVNFMGVSVFPSFDRVDPEVDAVIVTDFVDPRRVFDAAIALYGADRVLAPALLGLQPHPSARTFS